MSEEIGGTWQYSNHVIPEIPNKRVPEWATYIIGRSPQFKMHLNVGQAKSALQASGGICYRFMDGRWVAVAIIDGGTRRADYEFFTHGFKPDQPAHTVVIQEQP